MSNMPQHVLETFDFQASACRVLGSPFTAMVCEILRDNIDDSTAFGRRLIEWPETAMTDAIALRAAGALHALARSGKARDLSGLYPPMETNAEALWPVMAEAIARNDESLNEFLDSPPQTNEVSRSSPILGMCLRISERYKMPLALYEFGASAGLNLAFDTFYYNLVNDNEWGNPNALVVIKSEWRGKFPKPYTKLEVVSRAGCDRNPLDPQQPAAIERLLSYVWADQNTRIARLSSALTASNQMEYSVDKADAADWVEQKLAEPAIPGVARVFFHTIVWQYLTEHAKQRIMSAFEKAGAEATPETPLFLLSMETEGSPSGAVLTERSWPTGQLITHGLSDYHGRWVDWA